jgi:hypothetical protein
MNALRFVVLALIASGASVLFGQGRVPPGSLQTPPSRPQPEPQEPVATFRAGVRAIQIDAVVTDATGNPVRGLTADDFVITEKGKPQPITTFEAVDIPF